ncbi:MAG: hypothetical protein LDLANPLL_01812 [Turneriella sp.]|nr:hypothetical protein [Turneriella sp.]
MLRYCIIAMILLTSVTYAESDIHWFKSIPATAEGVESVHCIPEKKSILISYSNNTTAEWDYENLKLRKSIPGKIKGISRSRKTAVFVDSEKAVIRHLPSLAESWSITGKNFNQVLFSSQDQFLAIQQLGVLTIWLTSTHKRFLELQPPGRPPAHFDFSSNEQFLAISQYDKYTIALLDLKNQKQHASLNADKDFNAPEPLISPTVGFHKKRPILAYTETDTAYVKNIFKPDITCRLVGHSNFVTRVEFLNAPDELLTSGGRIDPRLIIWNHNTCKIKQTFAQHRDAVSAIDYIGETGIVSGDESGLLYAWDTRFPAKAIKLTGHKGIIMDLTVCAPEKIVALSDEDGRVNLWQLPTSFGN